MTLGTLTAKQSRKKVVEQSSDFFSFEESVLKPTALSLS